MDADACASALLLVLPQLEKEQHAEVESWEALDEAGGAWGLGGGEGGGHAWGVPARGVCRRRVVWLMACSHPLPAVACCRAGSGRA